ALGRARHRSEPAAACGRPYASFRALPPRRSWGVPLVGTRELEEHVLEARLGPRPAELVEGALGDDSPAVEDHDAIAQPLGHLEQMGRDQDAQAACRPLAQQIFQRARGSRVEPGEWL